MPDKILGDFIDPKWIDILEQKRNAEGLTIEELAEELEVEEVTIKNWKARVYNPVPKKQDKIKEKFGISFGSIRIKELILTVIHCSDRQISSNAKRVFVLLILFDGKIPGAKIRIEELETVGSQYGYKENRIDDALDQLQGAGLVGRDHDSVWLNYDGCKALLETHRKKF